MSDYNRTPRPQDQPRSRFGEAQPRQTAQPRPQPRQPAPQRTQSARQTRPQSVSDPQSGILPKGFWPLAGVCVLILAAGLLLQGFMPDGFPLVSDQTSSPRQTQMVSEIFSHGPLRINEVMTSNDGIIGDESGNTPDWIEVANISSRPVDLTGYVLARNAKAGNVFVFPNMTLQPEECVIVFADSQTKQEAGGELHAPFRLSSSGDVLMLFNPQDVAIDTVNIPALAQNAVYARTGAEKWEILTWPTPGMLNTDENYKALTTVTGNSDVQLIEVCSSSATYAPDENGICHDYVILKNITGDAVDLSGWYLSDTQTLPRLWRFPQGIQIPGGGTLTVHCSGLNRTENPEHLHTNFKLSSEGEMVILSDASGRPKDMVTFDLLKSDTAIQRQADCSWTVGTPTAEKTAVSTQIA